jgi:Cu+-exporting ATPase
VPRAVGDAVIAGAVNGATTVVVRVTAVGEQSTLSHLIRAVEEAQSQRAPIQQLVDRVSAVFVPLVLLAAALTLLWWGLRSGDWERALVHAVTVLVIACPCALGLATPAAITVGSGAAARAGILIREPRALEGARAVKTVVFDKTGTLTTGTPRLAQLEFFGNDQAHIRGLLRALQEGQSHPLARAVALATNDAPSVTVRELRVLPGLGVEAQLGTDVVLLGNAKLLAARGLAPPADGALTGMGLSYLVVADQVRARLAFADELRPGAREAVAALQRQGKRVVILSGDRARAVQDMHEALGTDGFHAEIGPAEKARVIGEIAQQGPVAMVGDGINDAPALARADLGVAMGGASDVAMQAADITLLRPDPRLVSAALEIAALTQRKIRQNLFWAFAYNVVGIPLAMGGVLSPMYAGLAMALSSVSVVTNALWLGRWKGSRRIAAL